MQHLQQEISNQLLLQPCNLIIFGATGDLTHRKLIPALYNLAAEGTLPQKLTIIGFARKEKKIEDFHAELETSTRKFSRTPFNDEIWANFVTSIFYHMSPFDNEEGYTKLLNRIENADRERGASAHRLYYLAVAPDQFPIILKHLRKSSLNVAPQGGWSRVIVEKPFGKDLKSAQELNLLVNDVFPESNTYRIDHYLGKETAQNIMVMRFANSIFESLWSSKHISHVQITAVEPFGIEGRAEYYDASGAMRDMVQNHLLQLLTLAAMEPPASLNADAIRDEKVKVLRSLRPITGENVFNNVVRAQYLSGHINGEPVPSYRNADGVSKNSFTETYVALQVFIDNWRWAGVPFFIRTAKRMPKGGTEIAVTFKSMPSVLFNQSGRSIENNLLLIRIQPNEGISFRVSAKIPGSRLHIEAVNMDFQYGTSFHKATPEAYERLLLDAISGDATLFARRDEVEEAWAFVDKIEEAWKTRTNDLAFYEAGSWGPAIADKIVVPHSTTWRKL